MVDYPSFSERGKFRQDNKNKYTVHSIELEMVQGGALLSCRWNIRTCTIQKNTKCQFIGMKRQLSVGR